MRSTTDKHTLSGEWDNIKIKWENWQEVFYWSVSVSFTSDIIIRWNEGEEEITISAGKSPMILSWATNNWFPFQVKWTWDLIFLTLN